MTFSWQRTLVVFRKELMDGFRDRRSLYSILVSALVSPLIMAVMFTTMAERQRSAEELRLPVAGQAFAPAFVDWLRQQSGVTVVEAPGNPEAAVRQGARVFNDPRAIRDHSEKLAIAEFAQFTAPMRM